MRFYDLPGEDEIPPLEDVNSIANNVNGFASNESGTMRQVAWASPRAVAAAQPQPGRQNEQPQPSAPLTRIVDEATGRPYEIKAVVTEHPFLRMLDAVYNSRTFGGDARGAIYVISKDVPKGKTAVTVNGKYIVMSEGTYDKLYTGMFANRLAVDESTEHLVETIGHELFHVTQSRSIENFPRVFGQAESLFGYPPNPYDEDAEGMGKRLYKYLTKNILEFRIPKR